MIKTPKDELNRRLNLFISTMSKIDPEWELAVLFDKINIFYFTGTMQNGVLFIFKNNGAHFFVRRNFDRAKEESEFENLYPVKSFKDIFSYFKSFPESVYIAKETLPIIVFERFNKYFNFKNIKSCDLAINYTRAVKSDYELNFIKKAGEIHRITKEEIVPKILAVGMSEFEFARELLNQMLRLGHHGVTRIRSYNGELYLGNICFGENSNYYNSFDGPGGIKGVCPAVPLFGNPDTILEKNMLIHVDTACGYMGYYTDKTQIYATGNLPQHVYDEHKKCVEIQNRVAELLKPGNTPSEIYEKVMSEIEEEFLPGFMGYKSNQVKFLGHGIGLHVDEYPAIAKGFDIPLVENMVIAVEPKKSIVGIGMVGIENTFLVTEKGGICLTGDNHEIINV
ncbi:aminopeptidase P family protein [Deferribacter autotrophicus]|uniref:Aminopeptidase P family protein n=1 Tax=Deferribacter autotrophicus TaxID=500465 RepID=A0A5A8F569_9BACT|nr:Xaa-Pro peptidase family protein [Deferribacter autotrophicus]KAA0258524.1 aminopeptidase P family protein [Deferribacter autotrophicus]